MAIPRIIISVLLVFISEIFGSEVRNYTNYKLYNIDGSYESLQKLKDFLMEKDESIQFISDDLNGQVLVPPEHVSYFKDLIEKEHLEATLLFDDVSEVIHMEKGYKEVNKLSRRRTFSWTSYYDVNEINDFLTNISRSNSNWTEVIVGGRSYEKRTIMGIRVNTPHGTNRMPPKPVFFIESGIHAREWIGPAATTYFINQLLTSTDPDIIWLRDQFDWRIFPTVNPDGYHFSYVADRYWRKTRSRSSLLCYGADPNRNWNFNWGQYSTSDNPCDYQLYCGSKPFSEVETRTLSAYISKIENLLFYVAFHSYASILLIPYSDSTDHVSNYDDLVQIGKTSLDYGYQVNKENEKYQGPAPAAEVLYKASGGSMDWVHYTLKTPLVYTYELRGKSFHWPPSKIAEQGDEVTQMMLGLAKEARNLGYF